MKDPTNKSVVSEMAAKQGLSAQELIKSWEEMDDEEYNWITETQHTVPMTALAERRAYPVLRVLVPPPGCGEPKELEDHVFEPLRKPDQRGVQTQILKRFLDKFIRNRWVPNYTLLDRRWYVAAVYQPSFLSVSKGSRTATEGRKSHSRDANACLSRTFQSSQQTSLASTTSRVASSILPLKASHRCKRP